MDAQSMFVSIILPTYNAAKTLGKSIQSVLNQTYLNWELIVVDDGSTDDTPEILSKYIYTDSRIKYLRLKNNGGCIARNEALKLAVGDYIAFIDADDLYEMNYLQVMVDSAIKFNADVVWCNHKEQFVDAGQSVFKEIQYNHKLKSNELLDFKELLKKYFRIDSSSGVLWNKFYRKSFLDLNQISFDEKRRRSGDWVFNIDVFRHKPNVVAVEDSLYCYVRTNVNSVVASFHEEDFENYKRSLDLLKKINQEYDLNVDKRGVNTDFLYNTISHLYRFVRSQKNGKKNVLAKIINDPVLDFVLKSNEFNRDELTMRYKVYLFLIRHKLSSFLFYLLNI